MKTDSCFILSEGFIIYEPGDSSVGIPPARYEVTGPFYFNDWDERLDFMKALKDAFLTFLEEGSFAVYDMDDWVDEE